MVTTPSVEEIEDRERRILDAAPFDAEHVPDAETSAYDARLVEPFQANGTVATYSSIVVDEGTEIELKTCQRWINDRHSHGGRRRGQFMIQQAAHEELCDIRGVYAALVLDEDEQLLAGRLVAPRDLDPFLTWSNGGGSKYATKRARLPWFKIVPKTDVERGASK